MTDRQAADVIAGWAADLVRRAAPDAIALAKGYTDAQRVQLLEAAAKLAGRLRRQATRLGPHSSVR